MINSIFLKYKNKQCVELCIEIIEQSPDTIIISMSGNTMDEIKMKELQQRLEEYNHQFSGINIKERMNSIKAKCAMELCSPVPEQEYYFCSYEKPLRSSFKAGGCDVSIRISCNGNCTANEVEIIKTPQSPDSPDRIFIGKIQYFLIELFQLLIFIWMPKTYSVRLKMQ